MQYKNSKIWTPPTGVCSKKKVLMSLSLSKDAQGVFIEIIFPVLWNRTQLFVFLRTDWCEREQTATKNVCFCCGLTCMRLKSSGEKKNKSKGHRQPNNPISSEVNWLRNGDYVAWHFFFFWKKERRKGRKKKATKTNFVLQKYYIHIPTEHRTNSL